ncbi:Penicillin-binding protein A [Pelotomaculum sp. FP]|uniref:peptidoglycan D,D-transpeptidase FtsI family protein n=1 Tax=Pelotomaculum sp. FP TaxID=261474 RepID=UPI0010656BDF|nr:penicillin-binding transpeptidase domain-containing protein [Pelotomaculum sp. FP]TEB17903.1 Penicillin-binding protein A [Pelotomaculum sp. FP]
MKHNILKLGYLLLGLLAVLVIYLSYMQLYRGPALADNPYNRRYQEYEAQVRRGTIYDTKGAALAKSDYSQSKNRRVYPAGQNTAQIIGYINERYGRAGLESAYDRNLLGMEGADRFRNLLNRLLGREQLGGDVTLTLDSALQKLAMDLLGGRRGAVVLLDPRTGAVRVMASSPSYDPNRLEDIWPQLLQDPQAPLINRATQGAYPPGSTFKIITAAAALATDLSLAEKRFDCPGYLVVNGFKLDDTAAHGEVDLTRALAVSCNTTFAQLGLIAGAEGFQRAVKAFGLLQEPPVGIPARAGTMAAAGAMTPTELASSAIGQGEVLVSPLQMALSAAAIANRGIIMQPYLVDTVKDSLGTTVKQQVARTWLTATTPEIAEKIKAGMTSAVKNGTAQAAAVSGMQVAGKTGSAQNPQGQTHAWFIGFAPSDQPRLAVAVVLENAGSGGAVAAPVAGSLLAAAVAAGY